MKNRFDVLDAFRGLCALFVTVFHMNFIGSITEATFFRASTLFVEFFFVLSGFVMAYGYMNKTNLNFKNFVIKRTFRILPLHLVMFAIFLTIEVLLFYLYQQGIDIKGEAFSGKNSVNEILPNLFLLQSWTYYTDKLSFNGPSWSISLEYYMYMIFFVSLLFTARSKYLPALFITFIAFACYQQDQNIINKDALLGLQCFFMGNITYLIYEKTKALKAQKSIFNLIELSTLLLVVFFIVADFEGKELYSPFIFSLVVWAFAFERGSFSTLFKHKFLVFLGLISYSIYLTHYFIISIFKSAMVLIEKSLNQPLTLQYNEAKYIDIGSPWMNNLAALLLLAAIIFIANFTYKYIEVKGQTLGRKYLSKVNE